MSFTSNKTEYSPGGPEFKPPFSTKCKDCGKEIWLHMSKTGKRYPTNSQDNRRAFHNCKKGPKVEKNPEPGTQFGGNAARQLDLELDLEKDMGVDLEKLAQDPVPTAQPQGLGYAALVSFPQGTTMEQVKAILTRLDGDIKTARILSIME